MRERWWRSPFILAGLTLWIASLAFWIMFWVVNPDIAWRMGATFAAFLVGGKFASVPTGLTLGLSQPVVGLIVTVPDAGAVLIAYPLLDKGLTALGRWSLFLASAARHAHEARKNKHGVVHRFGAFGVFLLTLSPIGFVSPVVVSAIGRIMGLRAVQVLVPVFAGMAVSAAGLVYGLGASLNYLSRRSKWLPYGLTAVFLLAMVGRELRLRWRAHRALAALAEP